MKIPASKKLKQQFRVEGKNYIPLGIVTCPGTIEVELHVTYGPLDGRPVYCYVCREQEPKKII